MSMALKMDVAKAARQDGTAKPVDLVHLSTQTMGDRALECEVLSIFLSQSQIYVSAYKAATDAGARKSAAHALKGAAKAIGAWHLAEIAEACERPDGDVGASLEALIAENERVALYIKTLVNCA